MARGLFSRVLLCLCMLVSYPLFGQVPTAQFTLNATAGCSPVVVQFTDHSTGAPTSWHWDLGNGGTSTLQNPSATYISPGVYTVILTATNTNGSTKDTAVVTVNAAPVVNFTADTTSTCGSKLVQFNNTTTIGAASAIYLWDFGDGDTSNAVNPLHQYTTSGNFTVSLVVINSNGCTSSVARNNYIKILPLPGANFTANSTNSCGAPFNVTFTNSSTAGIAYTWNFGDGNTSTSTSPSHTYTVPGSFTVSLAALGANGCRDTLVRTSYIGVGQLTAGFATTGLVCAGSAVSFTNMTTPAPATTRMWDFGNGNTSTAVNPTNIYNTAGTYTVRLIEGSAGCIDTVEQNVTINPKPVVDFVTNDTLGCNLPHTANFTNLSTGAVSYAWNFGFTTSTATNPSVLYPAYGSYSVVLKATSSPGCESSLLKPLYVKVNSPDAAVTASQNGACVNSNIIFTATLTTAQATTNYCWDFGDGSAVVNCATCSVQNHSYTSTGTYTVTMVVSLASGCNDTVTKSIKISTTPTAAFSGTPLTVCPKSVVTFTNSSTGATGYTWAFGDGLTDTVINPQHFYNNPQKYTVRLIASNDGCNDTLERTDYVTVQLPEADFRPGFACSARLAYTFTDSCIGANTYSWDFGDGNTSTTAGTVTHTYAAPGTYIVVLRVTNTASGCTDTMARTISAQPIVVPNFTANDTTICPGTILSVTRGGGSEYTYATYFGSQLNAFQDTAVGWLATTPGIYNVKLVVTDANGCRDSATKTNYIRVGGTTANFTASDTTPCKGDPVLFTDVSVAGAFPIVSRNWDFGDATSAATASNTITHTHSNKQSYTIKMLITDANGCKDSVTKNGYINVHKPVAQFYTTDTAICAGGSVKFNVDTVRTNYIYAWNFGDGNTGTVAEPTHVYNSLGTFSVRMVLTDTFGCVDTAYRDDYIKAEQPTAAFTLSDTTGACPPLTVLATNTTTGTNTYAWTFGNNNQSSAVNPSITYTYPGIHTVKLVATNQAGCKDSATMNVVLSGPTGSYSYTPKTGCNPLQVSFTATSSNTTTYIWDMNNGVTQNTAIGSYSYTYTQKGKYVPTVILSDGASCLVPLQNADTVTVDELQADFSFTVAGNFCDNDTIRFNDTTLTSYSDITTRNWDFGDGNTGTGQDPVHFYSTPGTYVVKLVIVNVNGCSDTIQRTITIHSLPNVQVAAASDSLCPDAATGIQLTATGADTYAWTPATGLSCTNCNNPVALPQVHTSYIVVGTDTNGCTNSDTVAIGIRPKPVVLTLNDTAICDGVSIGLTATGAFTYTWSPATGLSCTGCANPLATPPATTTYTIIGASAAGCKDTTNITITMKPNPVVTAGNDASVCSGDSTQLQGSGAASYSWSPAATLSCATCSSPYAKPITTTLYQVTGTAANGCTDTGKVTVTVNGLPTVNTNTDTAICAGASVALTATGAAVYNWSPAAGLSCTGCANPVATPAATTTYRVIGENGNSCKDTATVTITVNALPVVNAGSDVPICAGLNTTLTATGATTYTWTPATGLSCTNCAAPTASPVITTNYIVTGIDGNSCIGIDTVTVTVNNLPVVDAGNDKSICPADTVQLPVTGASTYVWTPATGLSCAGCSTPGASPAVTTTYIVTGTDGNGCKNTDTIQVAVNATPVVSAGSNVAICFGDATNLQATGAASYTWSPAAGLSCTGCANPVATPTATTTYTVIGANGSSCKDTATVTVTVNTLPVVNAGSDVPICAGLNTTLTATGATTYTWIPATGLSCTNCASPIASPAITTNYIVTGTDGNSCKDTDTVTVTVNALPLVDAGTNISICPADSTQLTATGASSYTWSPASGLSCTGCAAPKASPAATVTYTVTGTDGNGCKNTDTIQVAVNATPVVSAGSNVAICFGDATNLQATGASSYTWSPAAGLSCTGCANPVATPTATTTYTVIGANGSSCKDTATVIVTVNTLPVVNAGSDVAICTGLNTTLTATGATTYTWTPATGLSCTNCTSPTANPMATTSYIVTGTDGNGCKDTGVVKVTVNALPVVSAGSNTTICLKDSAQLQATGAVTYAWTPSTGLSCTGCSNPKASPAAATAYTVTGTDANGCKNTAGITVSVNALPVISAGADKTICNGSNVQLQATGGVSYTWSPATGLSCTNCPNPVANPSATTTYTITGTDGNGCINTEQIKVNVNALPTVSAGSNVTICLKDSTQLQGTGAVTYAWSPTAGLSCVGCANPKASPANTTVYTVTGTDANGCINTANVTVTINILPVVKAGNDAAICKGIGTPLSASGASSYTWTPTVGLSCSNCAAPTANPATSTTYIVKGTDANSCSAFDTVTVNVNTPPIVSGGANITICANDSAKLQATGAAGYTWSPAGSLSCAACPNPVAAPTATAIYEVIGTDANGCKDTAQVTVTVTPRPVVTASVARALVCEGDTTRMQANGATAYTWSPATGLSCVNCANPIATLQGAATYVVTGTTNGCSDTETVQINTMPKPIVNAGKDTAFCKGATTMLQATGNVTDFTWTPAIGLSCTNCPNPEVNINRTTRFILTGTDANGCSNTDDVLIVVHELPAVDAGADKTLCDGSSVQLFAQGATSYFWSPSTGLSCVNCPAPYAAISEPLTYKVTGIDGNGCVNTDEVTVTPIKKQPVTYSDADSICEGATAELSATGGTSYEWWPLAGLNSFRDATVTASPLATTEYRVIIKQGDCFTDTGYVSLFVFSKPKVDAGEDRELRGGNEVRLEPRGEGIATYQWSPAEFLSCADCANPLATPLRTTTFRLKVASEFGCEAEDDVTVKVTCGTDQMFVANTFTPNNDGVNDMFFPQGKGLTTIQRFSVYSRWGELVYEAQNIPINDARYGWNGTYKSELLKPDVFVYMIRTQCEDGTPLEIKGDVSLVR